MNATQTAKPVILHHEHHPSSRAIPLEGGHNIRDLGGLPLRDRSGVVDCGKILRGEAPNLLAPEGVRRLLSYGVTSTLDLRSPGEVDAEGHGHLEPHRKQGSVNVYHVPLLNNQDWATDPAGRDDDVDISQRYLDYLSNGGSTLVGALKDSLARSGALYVHCAVGKDRTGIVIAALLDALEVDTMAIVDDYVYTAHVFHPVIRALGQKPTYQRDLANPVWSRITPERDAMEKALAALQAQGGGEAWLLDNGLSAEELQSWRTQLIYRPEKPKAAPQY